jgi:hypothetical protein
VFVFVLADGIKESVCTAIYLHAVSRSQNTTGESAFIPQTSFDQFSPFLLLWVSDLSANTGARKPPKNPSHAQLNLMRYLLNLCSLGTLISVFQIHNSAITLERKLW